MEEKRKKKFEGNKQKERKKINKQKKADVESLTSENTSPSQSLENIVIVGKGLSQSKSVESGIQLHVCDAVSIIPFPGIDESLKTGILSEELEHVPSNISFISAQSDISEAQPNKVQKLEDTMALHNVVNSNIKTNFGKKESNRHSSAAVEPGMSLRNINVQGMEEILNLKERKIKELQNKYEECCKAKDKQLEENRGLAHKIGFLNRQLASMYELLGKKDWKSPIDPSELAKCNSKISELEAVISAQDEDNKELTKRIQDICDKLEAKEKELFSKNKELIDYKNRSTLEMCKLINQIDCLQSEAKLQSELLELKIQDAQKSMDDEIINVTLKLEDQYQIDVKNAIEKFHADFEKLADLPKTAIQKLLNICEPENIDLVTFQKDWDRQQALLESKIQAMQSDHRKELLQLRDSYEGKILFLKAQVESLTSQLKERKEILDVFESELTMYKSNSSMNLLKASTLGDDISSLKELYTTEIFSQKQVHKLQLGIFEEKVKTLTEEILYHAKNEEIHLQELKNAKKMAFVFREKYEQLVAEWEEKVGGEFSLDEVTSACERDVIFEEFKSLIEGLKQSEGIHEERLKLLESRTDNERLAYLKEIETFRMKLEQLEKFQKTQAELDENIQELIKALGVNYTKTVDALTTSHTTELTLKHLEMCSLEKRHIEEMEALKNNHEKEVEELRLKIERIENFAEFTESERNLRKIQGDEMFKQRIEEVSLGFLKSQGMIAIKEETEQTLNDRIRELEDAMKEKEENCRKELEDLTAKFIQLQVLSSAKEDLAKELEDKLNKSEKMLKKSCKEVDKLQEGVTLLEENLKIHKIYPNDGGDYATSVEILKKFEKARLKGEQLKIKILEVFDRVEHLEGLNQSSGDGNESLEERKVVFDCERANKILDENHRLTFENSNLVEEITKMQKTITEMDLKNSLLMEELQDIKKKLAVVETEKTELLLKVKTAEEEKEEIQQRNDYLEQNIQDLTNKMDILLSELANNRGSKGEVFSISLQEVRVLYQEEQETELDTGASTSTFGCQTVIDPQPDESIISLLKTNKSLKKENACLKMELRNKSKRSFYEEMICKFRNIQEELLVVLNERDELLMANEELRKERDYFKEEMENLVENFCIRESKVPEITGEDTQHKSLEMKEEIEKLTEYIKVLSTKLDIMKTNNDILLSKSQDHLKHNQNLVNELEEAWSQRYEIEEQLAKVRKENALLNQHRNQLEETNRRISSLVAEGKPSVVSWIKIHETVENIVDEVLALKTSFSSSSVSGASTSVEVPRTTSELKMMTETLHIQLKNKTMLCDELIIQKETLERELKSLESLIKESPKSLRRCSEEPLYSSNRRLDIQNIPSRSSPMERRRVLEWNVDCFNSNRTMRSSDNSHLVTLNRLKKHLEDEVEWEEAQFRENLELEIKGLRTQMQKEEETLNAMIMPSKEDQNMLDKIKEQEILEIRKEFAREIEKLKTSFDSEKKNNAWERCGGEIDRLKNYFEKRWDEVKRRYHDLYNIRNVYVQLPFEEEKIDGSIGRSIENKHESMLKKIRLGYETVLEEERRKCNYLLEEAKQKHDLEMLALEEFWTEKLSECETKCAIMKATRGGTGKSREKYEENFVEDERISKPEKLFSEEEIKFEENQSDKLEKDIQIFNCNYSTGLQKDEEKPQDNFCVSCLSKQSYLGRMEVKTDDDKLDIILHRDALKEMVASMQLIISELLAFIGYQKGDLSNTFDLDNTMYKSVIFDTDKIADVSVVSSTRLSLNLSALIKDLTENSLLNSSDQVRFELEKCLKQLQKDAKSILALSSTDSVGLNDIIKKFEKEKSKLEDEVLKVEKVQRELKKEIELTKEKLNLWERNLEVVSEGYGEEIVKPKQMISLCDLKGKLNTLLGDDCTLPSQEINVLEDICKESERLQEKWKQEKDDLQQQIDVADKQVHSLRKFLEEQAIEREQEREAFDKEVNQLRENLKARERDNALQNRTNREMEALEGQLKELTVRLTQSESNKSAVEGEFQNAVKKIWSLREVIQDLEVQLAEVTKKESLLKKKIEKLELLIEEQDKINRDLKEKLDICENQNETHYLNHLKTLEEKIIQLHRVADQVDPDSLAQLSANLRQIELTLIKKTKDLEQLHVSSANVSCSSPSEDVSIRDHLDATRCSTPDEMCTVAQSVTILPLEEIERVHEKLTRHTRAEEVTMKYIQDLKMQLRNLKKALDEVQTERDILLEKVDVYLKENSGLKARLEEQRCNAGILQKQLNANLESQIVRLETDIEKLKNLCDEKDKQLSDLKIMLENTRKSLNIREMEALNRSKEENNLITTLRMDLANAISENEKLEHNLEKMREKLKESMTMPALVDSMLDEKNAEIDRLEKEVLRLSSEKVSCLSSTTCSMNNKKRKIKFSEPDSFSENISSISPHGSDLRNCSGSFGDFRNSSWKIKHPMTCSTKLESISSIAPLQLSPRGANSPGILSWKESSPLVYNLAEAVNPSKNLSNSLSQSGDFPEIRQISKLESEIESKHREISELNLETDKLKRQIVEINQELTVAKTETREAKNEITTKDEEIRKLKNNEKSLFMTIESLKRNHAEEVDELHKKLISEREKAEKEYEEIKALEKKKIEIEESFLSLKEDYNEKIKMERKTAEILLDRIKVLEIQNEESEAKLTVLEKDMETAIKKSEETVRRLSKEILGYKDLKEKMPQNRKNKTDAETQVEFCQEDLILKIPKSEVGSFENVDKLKLEFDKMTAVIEEKNFNKTEARTYALAVKKLITSILEKLDELSKELDVHRKKLMECSIDDLAVKVQKELLLSAALDNNLLSNIEVKVPRTGQLNESGGGDNVYAHSLPGTEMLKLYKEITERITSLENEKEHLQMKLVEQQEVIRFFEDNLKNEKDKLLEEKKRATEDAKIMELLRVNLEKALHDIKVKEKELEKEKQQRMALERKTDILKKQNVEGGESKKVMELNAQLESQKEKIISIGHLLEEEKRKNQELKLSLEGSHIERMSDKNAQKLIESNFSIVKEQKESLKKELMNAKKLLDSRNIEIRFLKQKINLQEIDIKTLSLSNDLQRKSESETSSVHDITGNFCELPSSSEMPSSILTKMKKLNSCVQRHVKESTEMGETLLYLSQETKQMKDLIRKLEQSEAKVETLESDPDIEKKLWALEKGGLMLEIETTRSENEILKRDLVEACKNTELLRLENSQLKKEKSKEKDGSKIIENEFLQDRVSYLTRKYLRTESYRKALAWQKNFLMIALKDYQRSEEDAWKKITKKTKERRFKKNGYFRVVALAVISVFRMKFIVKKWRKNALNDVHTILNKNNSKHKLVSLESILNIYNEPINPLSYQTQNIFSGSSSRVLRTPPCRDTGPRSYSLDSKKRPNCLETFPYLQGKIDATAALP